MLRNETLFYYLVKLVINKLILKIIIILLIFKILFFPYFAIDNSQCNSELEKSKKKKRTSLNRLTTIIMRSNCTLFE